MSKQIKVQSNAILRLKLPDHTKKIIAEHKTEGDFSAISISVFGSNEQRQLIKAAIVNGEGRERVIAGIVRFYAKKAGTVKKLAS